MTDGGGGPQGSGRDDGRRVLAADLGGTRARFALFALDGTQRPRPIHRAAYPSADLDGVRPALRSYLREVGEPALAAVCLGVAGAVHGNHAWLTNLGWEVDGVALGRELGVPLVLINDLQATAIGLRTLAPEDLRDLNPGEPVPGGHAVLLGAGTGLGMALLVQTADGCLPVPSEGGHVELAPRDEEQWRLKQFLAARLGGRVSVERVVSGTGLRNLYDFLLAEGLQPAPRVVERLTRGEDAGGVIGEHGLAGDCEVCVRVLDLFASCFGAVAGDVALLTVARGGVLLAGGVSLRLADKLTDGTFHRAFIDKGRLSHLVERVPVRIVMHPDPALQGAALHAVELARGDRG